MKIRNTKNEIRNRQSGFTVLESIVAIFVLSLSISGVFSAIQRSLSQSIISRDEVRAFYLAQEAVELVRNKRDINYLTRIVNGSSVSWLDGITTGAGSCPVGNVCRIDANVALANSIVNCGSVWDSCPENLRQDSSGASPTYKYGHNAGWNVTNFKREIKFEAINADEIAMIVQITWTKGAIITKQFKIRTHLLNWL